MIPLLPEPPKVEQPKFASRVVGRRPEVKYYTKKQHASSAVTYNWPHRSGQAYEFIDGEWIMYRDTTPPACFVCGLKGFYMLDYKAVPKESSPVACRICYNKHFGYKALEPMEKPIGGRK